jgi:hypothetical protein
MQHRKTALLLLSLLLCLSGCLSIAQNTENSAPYPALVNVTIGRTTGAHQVPISEETTSLPTPTSMPTTERTFPRPSTGTIESGDQFTGGQGQLTIDNALGGSDAVAVLTIKGTEQALVAVYIQDGDIFTIQEIPDDEYILYMIRGGNWDPQQRRFTRDVQYLRVDVRLIYTTTNTESTSKMFFFHKVPNEYDPATTVVDQQAFPRL